MIGVVLLAASWVLLRLERKPLSVLGFNRPAQRSVEFAMGVVVAASFACAQFVLQSQFAHFSWVRNPDLSLPALLDGLHWTMNSVLYEELLFRGYLLYKAIELFGPRTGCFLSAGAFGIYHWFSYGVLGSVVPMLYVFVLTGTFGLMLAFAFARSRSVVLPIALHLGWNVSAIAVFSSGPIGDQLLIQSPREAVSLSPLAQLLINVLLPLSLPLLVLWVMARKVPVYARSKQSTA